MRILFLVPYPVDRAPSQRFRVEKLLYVLDAAGFQYRIQPFLDSGTADILYKKGYHFWKATGILKGYLKRFKTIFYAKSYDLVFIHREAAPIGPPVFEWIVKKLLKKKIVYDFDDAIWIENTSNENQLANHLKCSWKIKYICKWADTISAGNDFLTEFAYKYCNGRVYYMPTVVNTNYYRRVNLTNNRRTVIGWTGTHSTLKYLDSIVPVLQRLARRCSFEMIVIADKNPNIFLPNYTFIPWSKEDEIKTLSLFDIGLMPLEADAWSEGKCGFKIIQYMALEIAAVASPVGVNKTIINQGVNGVLCDTEESWESALEQLLIDKSECMRLGKAARLKIENEFSTSAYEARFLELFSS